MEDSVFLNQPNMVNVYIDDVQNAHCTDDEDGTATAYAGGGILNSYSYLWDNAETTATAVNLAAGTHTVTVTDANGCEATDDAAVDFDYNLPVVDLGPADTGYCEGWFHYFKCRRWISDLCLEQWKHRTAFSSECFRNIFCYRDKL